MKQWPQQFTFTPEYGPFATEKRSSSYTALSGANNSGKSAYLKGLWTQYGAVDTFYLPVSRFISSIQLKETGPSIPNLEYNAPTMVFNSGHNLDTHGFDVSRMVRSFSNERREHLFSLAEQWIGSKWRIERLDPNNDLSDPVMVSEGVPLESSSTGTRLLISMLAICCNPQFKRILIDEPELGLSPMLQSKLAESFIDISKRKEMFPHLSSIVVATHSHIFLDRTDFTNNYFVTRQENSIQCNEIKSMQEFHRLQFNLLGNSLSSFFLPDLIVIVEGKTDYPYIKKIIASQHPDRSIIIIESQGSPKDAVRRLSLPLGGISSTPYKDRILVIFDSVYSKDQKEDIKDLGISENNLVIWDRNGIEYLYPKDIMSHIFHKKIEDRDIVFSNGDHIDIGGTVRTKKQLSDEVVSLVNSGTQYPKEIQEKLLSRISEIFT